MSKEIADHDLTSNPNVYFVIKKIESPVKILLNKINDFVFPFLAVSFNSKRGLTTNRKITRLVGVLNLYSFFFCVNGVSDPALTVLFTWKDMFHMYVSGIHRKTLM